MSLFLYTRPFENSTSLFDDMFDDDFFNTFTSRRSFGCPCHTRRHHHRSHHRNPYVSLEKQLFRIVNNETKKSFQWVDFAPKINFSEDEKHYYIHADLPGLSKDQVKMELDEDRILTISGEREYTNNNSNKTIKKGKEESKEEGNEMETEQTEQQVQPEKTQEEKEDVNVNEVKKDDGKHFSVKECSYGTFSRSFSLPEDANIENIQAKMENGVLEVVIDKMEPLKPQNRTIQIQ